MVFDDYLEDFYQHSFDSPDLRPIALPMSGFDKSMDGMISELTRRLTIAALICIDLHSPNAAFPGSNALQYLQPLYANQLVNSHVIASSCHDLEPESDSEFGYGFDYPDQENMNAAKLIESEITSRSHDASHNVRKRKASSTPEYVQPQPQKKPAIAHIKLEAANGDFHDFGQSSPYAASFAQAHANVVGPYGPRTVNNSPRLGHSHSTSNASQISLAAPSPLTPAFSPSFTTVRTDQSPRAPMTPAPRPASVVSPYNANNPKLVRTSTIPQQASPGLGVSMAPGMQTHTFNPYSMYPHNKATLKLNGDLDAVASEWSPEELEVHRKLVVFTRSQTGSVIDAEFKVVPQQDWQRSDITVNCIWWKEKKEAYVTSVDTIALLEQLVAVRFTVEEKNRIRRNLEGFRPLTVSKAKSDSEEFFKVIMGFPNPKPRNIEKDVKVFPWKILAPALKKIIGKYSASYSSTASAMSTPANTGYPATEHPVEYQYVPSPAQEFMTQGMPQPPMPAVYYDASMMHGRMMPVSTQPTELSVQIPPMGAYDMAPPAFVHDGAPMMPHSMQMAPHPASAPLHQTPTGWAFPSYAGDGNPYVSTMSAPASAYPRGHIEVADFVASGYPMPHHLPSHQC